MTKKIRTYSAEFKAEALECFVKLSDIRSKISYYRYGASIQPLSNRLLMNNKKYRERWSAA